MKYLGTALNNTNFTSVFTYANTLYTDSQKALDDSALYNVSPDLQGAKDEYQLSMVQLQSAAFYVHSGVETYKKGNAEAGNFEMKQAVPSINSFREHFSRAQNLLKTYKYKN